MDAAITMAERGEDVVARYGRLLTELAED